MGAPRKEFSGAVEMYRRGFSVADVAAAFGRSRQAMWKILMRRGVRFRSNLRFLADNHFFRGGAIGSASSAVTKAVANGILVVGPCEVCGLPPAIQRGRQRIHGHHDDYNFPLKVRWLCKRHHHDWHISNKPIERTTSITPRREIASLGGRASWRKHRDKHLASLAKARAKRWGRK